MANKFKVKHEVWLAIETERIKDILIGIKYWGVKWTRSRLRRELDEIGLTYSAEEIAELNDALHAAGIVEDIAEEEEPPE